MPACWKRSRSNETARWISRATKDVLRLPLKVALPDIKWFWVDSICPICAAGQVPSLCLKFPIRGGRCILGGACQNYGREKLNLQAEHGVDPCARALGRRLSAFKRGKRRLLGGWHRSRRLLDGRLIHRGHRSRSRSAGSCDARDCSGWRGSELLQIGKIARLFGARLNGGE